MFYGEASHNMFSGSPRGLTAISSLNSKNYSNKQLILWITQSIEAIEAMGIQLWYTIILFQLFYP